MEPLASAISADPDLYPLLRERFAKILEDPTQFARMVMLRLSVDYLPDDENDLSMAALELFLTATCGPARGNPEECSLVKRAFIAEGLVDGLLKALLTMKPFEARASKPLGHKAIREFASMLFNIAFLLEFAITKRDEIPLTFLDASVRRQISLCFRDVWCHREQVFFDPEMPAGWREAITSALLACGLQLEILCNLQDESLLSSTQEIGLVLLSSWIHIKDYTDLFNVFFIVVNSGLDYIDTKRLWAKVLKTFMSDVKQAEGIIQKCVRSLRGPHVDGCALTEILVFAEHMINRCDDRIFGSLYESWIRLLVNTSRACDRQLCQYGEDSEWRSRNLTRGIIIIHTLLFSDHLRGILADTEHRFATMDFVSFMASYSVDAVTEGPDFVVAYMQKIICIYRAMPGKYGSLEDELGLAMLLDTADRRVPDVIAALSQIPETSNQVKARKKALLRSWDQYSKALALEHRDVVLDSKASLFPVPAWTTCAARSCPCYRKKPHHQLRVCKGCWQVYYCGVKCQTADWQEGGHESLCRRIKQLENCSD